MCTFAWYTYIYIYMQISILYIVYRIISVCIYSCTQIFEGVIMQKHIATCSILDERGVSITGWALKGS